MVERIINGRRTSTAAFSDLYPFESRFKKINGHAMHYIDQGSGPAVVMVHGNPTWSFYFRHLVMRLSGEFRTIAMDHIGCGLSDKPGAHDYDYTLESRVRDLDTLISALDLTGKINLVVHDWGGMIGLAWALDHPDRINKIVITNTAGFFLPKSKQLPRRLWLLKYLKWFAVPAVLGLNLFARAAVYMTTTRPLPVKVKKGLLAPYNSWKNRIATLKFVQDIPIDETDPSHAMVKQVDLRLAQLNDRQLLLLWGTHDFVFDLSFYNEFKQRFPKARSCVFNRAGHYLFEDCPEETAACIRRFLKS